MVLRLLLIATLTSALAPVSRVRLPRLAPDRFRHPDDNYRTQQLEQSAAGQMLATFTRRVVAPLAEDSLALDALGSGVRVSEKQFPRLHGLLVEACDILGLRASRNASAYPTLFVRQDPRPNAYTLAISGREPAIVVHSSLLELMDEREVQAVLAHELGHVACDHGVWLSAARTLALGAGTLADALGGAGAARAVEGFASDALGEWQRAAELSCDRAALLVVQDADVVVRTLLKLSGGAGSFGGPAVDGDDFSGLSAREFVRQAKEYDEAASRPLAKRLRLAEMMTQGLTHPLPVKRALEVDRFANSPQFRGLIARGAPLHSPAELSAEEAS